MLIIEFRFIVFIQKKTVTRPKAYKKEEFSNNIQFLKERNERTQPC